MKADHIVSNAEQLTLFAKRAKDIAAIPVIGGLLADLCPSLLDGSAESARILRDIAAFLGDKKNTRFYKLEREIPTELFTALCGVKSMLRYSNLNALLLNLEYNKKQLGERLKDTIGQGF